MSSLSVWQLFRDFAARPYDYFVRGWHWKGALFSALIRCGIFFSMNLSSGWKAAYGAAFAEFCYRIVASGFYASMTQGFRRCEPAWAAYLTAMLFLPIFQHAIEFYIHWLRGTPKLMESMAASIAFTMLSTSYNLYSMRQGTMVVGPEGQSVWRDILSFPRILFGFLTAGPRTLWRTIRTA
jgi:hypothetical protein